MKKILCLLLSAAAALSLCACRIVSGGDGSLNPDSTYSNWMWILVRNAGGAWKHVDHGY